MTASESSEPADFDEIFADAIERAASSVVSVHARKRFPSSGTVWNASESSYIVTASHAVEREEELTIGIGAGDPLPATLLGRDYNTDLAVLQADAPSVPPITMRTRSSRVGNLVFAVGRPFNAIAATFGSITAVAPVPVSKTEAPLLIAAEVTPLPGFSGGPLIGSDGAAHGINTSGLVRSGILLSSGRGFVTIPAAQVSAVVADIVRFGHVRFGWIGVGVKPVPLPDEIRVQLNDQASGLMVTEVKPESPAKDRLAIGDTLVRMGDDNHPLTDVGDLQQLLGSSRIGTPTTITFIRNDSLETTEITPIERPERFRC
ncbi:MAG: S1C family serine protease [Thermomicrobiales bacterium]